MTVISGGVANEMRIGMRTGSQEIVAIMLESEGEGEWVS
jgi:hypothetical protein